MKRIADLSCLVLLLIALAGCGGSSSSTSNTSAGSTNAALAGTYIGTLTYSVGGYAPGLVNLAIGPDGAVTGTELAGTANNSPDPLSGTIDTSGNANLTETETVGSNVATTTITGTLNAGSVTGGLGGALPFKCVNTNGFTSQGIITFALIKFPGTYSGTLTYTTSVVDSSLIGESGPITLAIASGGAVTGTEQAGTTNQAGTVNIDPVTGTIDMTGLTGVANFAITDNNGTSTTLTGNLTLNPSTGVLSGALPFTAGNTITGYMNSGTLTLNLAKQ